MTSEQLQVASGVDPLDDLLGGLRIGDNVLWYDNAGSLATVFYLNFIKASQAENKSIIYLNFDKSIKSLLQLLGPLANYKNLTVLDCFTHGKGEGADIFLKFYANGASKARCRIILIDEPENADHVTGAFYGLHKTMTEDVRFVFDSLTGMQQLWGGEDHILKLYSHACPRLYELNTIAYWIIEKEAHSQQLRAHINKIAQVAIELSLKRGKTSLTVVKAQNRNMGNLNRPFSYWNKDLNITFDANRKTTSQIDLGERLKDLRKKRGISQTELARLVGVTPSTISQVESSQIYPSLPALFKIAEILSVRVTSFFHEMKDSEDPVIFPAVAGAQVPFSHLPKGSIKGKLLTPVDLELKTEPYVIEISAGKTLASHFFIHKGEEMGYVLSGRLQLKMEKGMKNLKAGDTIYLKNEAPVQWKNTGAKTAKLLWVKIK